MISILNKSDCCGCSACAERCPRQSITMQADKEGFLYPAIDENSCIHCDLCDKVCPIINQTPSVSPIAVYAAKHKSEAIRMQSSSGGAFSALAEVVIKEGGVVFGARFDNNWQVVHSYTEASEGLIAFRGSKYVQSVIGESYLNAERFLKDGRKVLFSGTPCQIAGLKHFLRKEYDNLLTVDVICHGVPSPIVWETYIEEIWRPKGAAGENTVLSLKDKPVITGLSFRDKRAGWRKFGFSVWNGATEGSDENSVFPSKNTKRIIYEIQQQNVFLRGFLQNLYLRPSCHQCKFRNFKSGSDITMADFWGVRKIFPKYAEDKGLSLVVIKNDIDKERLGTMELQPVKQKDFTKAFTGNSSAFKDDEPSSYRDSFWKEYLLAPANLVQIIKNCTHYSLKQKLRDNIDIFLLKIGLYGVVKNIVNMLRRFYR